MTRPDRPALVAAAQRSIRKGSKSFATASRLFDRETRERVWLLYAWCRACDDIADEQDHGHSRAADGAEPLDPAARLATIRTLTELALAGEDTGHDAFDALGQLASEVPITRTMIDDVLAGFALDAEDWRPQGEADLLRYCYHVAGAVGVLMAVVMGVPVDEDDPLSADTLDRACDLGLAFQLSNIARDVVEDHAIGRCYIPAAWLAPVGITPAELTAPHNRDALVTLVARLCALAARYEASARIGARRLGWRQGWAVLSAANIYGAIGRTVARLGPAALTRRVRIGKRRKLAFMLGALVETWTGGQAMDATVDKPLLSRRELASAAHAR